MTPRDIYRQLLSELADEIDQLQRDILDALWSVQPEPVSRVQLVYAIFGYFPTDISNDKHDRKIRKAIEQLREFGFPVVSSSSESGYRLDISLDALDAMRAENASRIERLAERNRAIERTKQKVRTLGTAAVPHEVPAQQKATQPRLLGG